MAQMKTCLLLSGTSLRGKVQLQRDTTTAHSHSQILTYIASDCCNELS